MSKPDEFELSASGQNSAGFSEAAVTENPAADWKSLSLSAPNDAKTDSTPNDGTGKRLKVNRLILTLLCVAAFISAAAILLQRFYLTDPPVDPPAANPYVYEFPRDARATDSEGLLWETNIGGSKDDLSGRVYALGDKLYSFGTTYSADYDMKSGTSTGDIFLTVLDKKGRLISTQIFGSGHDDRFIEARVHHSGFLILAATTRGGGTFDLYHFESVTTKITQLQFNFPLERTPLSMYYDGEYILIVAEHVDANLDKHIPYIILLDNDFRIVFAQDILQTASFEYTEVYPSAEGYVVFGTAYEGTATFPCFLSIDLDGNYKLDYFERYSANARLLFVMPSFSGGYVIITSQVDKGKVTRFVLLSLSLLIQKSVQLPMVEAESAYMFFNEQGYFVLTHPVGNTDATASFFDKNHNLISNYVNGLERIGKIADWTTAGNLVYLLSTKNEADAVLTILNPDRSIAATYTLGGSKSDTAKGIITDGSHVYLICDSASSDGTVGYNFGGLDNWIAEFK